MRQLFYLFLVCHPLFGGWDPSFADQDQIPLRDPNYLELKQNVISVAKNPWCSKEKIELLMDLIALEKPSCCVEIGALTNSSALSIGTALQWTRKGRLYAITNSSLELIRRTWKLYAYCIPLCFSSKQASCYLEGIDFLHIDGNSSEQDSLEDIHLFFPKVKPGGFILLSNIHCLVDGEYPKYASYRLLTDWCEVIEEIENENAVLFKKPTY